MLEDFLSMRRLGELAGQILSGKMQKLVESSPPLRAIGYIIDDPLVSDEPARSALAGVPPQLILRDCPLREIHGLDYTG